MANSLTKIKTNALADDAVTGAKIADDTVAEANMANDAIGLAEIKAGTDGQILTFDASGNPSYVGPGSDGQVLTSTGAGSPPAFETLSAGETNRMPLAGGTFTGDVTFTGDNYNVTWDKSADHLYFADNAKAVFGALPDLSIYHDGSHSYIKDAGTGQLRVQTSTLSVENAAGGENVALFDENGAVTLYYDNAAKFETLTNGSKTSGNHYLQGAGTVELAIGSTDAGGAKLTFDGDSNGDWSGGDYSSITHTTSGDMEYDADNPSGATNHIFKTAGTERVRILAAGGIAFNGDTAAANALDDYEEGTWTPVSDNDATYSSQSGSYTKIGRFVFVFFNFQLNQINSGANNAIWGLPFAVSPNQGFGQHGYFANLSTNVRSLIPYAEGTTKIMFHAITTSDGFSLNQAIFQNNTRVDGSICYQTSA